MKRCKDCGEIKDVALFVNKENQCKACRAAHKKKHYVVNREAIAAYMKKYNKKHYAKNKEAIAAQKKQYNIENKEAIADQKKHYYVENKEAISDYQKQYYAENREAIAAYRAENRAKHMLQSARRRAKAKGLDLNITESYIQTLLDSAMFNNSLCSFSGCMSLEGDRWSTPSLDRIDNTEGYVTGNVQIIPTLSNTRKSNFTHEQILEAYDLFKTYLTLTKHNLLQTGIEIKGTRKYKCIIGYKLYRKANRANLSKHNLNDAPKLNAATLASIVPLNVFTFDWECDKRGYMAPELDHIDPALGNKLSNLRIIPRIINVMKLHGTDEEAFQWLHNYKIYHMNT